MQPRADVDPYEQPIKHDDEGRLAALTSQLEAASSSDMVKACNEYRVGFQSTQD